MYYTELCRILDGGGQSIIQKCTVDGGGHSIYRMHS